LFPCQTCRGHFKKMLQDFPVKNANREELVLYLCGLHNKVNERLSKPIFDCNKAFEFWGGNCGCQENKSNTNESKVANQIEKEKEKEK
jgi:FAD-linked sulfhydryl oxidase